MSRDDSIVIIHDVDCWLVLYCQAVENVLTEVYHECPVCGYNHGNYRVDLKKFQPYHWQNTKRFSVEMEAMVYAKNLYLKDPGVEYGISYYDTVDLVRAVLLTVKGHTPGASSSAPDEV